MESIEREGKFVFDNQSPEKVREVQWLLEWITYTEAKIVKKHSCCIDNTNYSKEIA